MFHKRIVAGFVYCLLLCWAAPSQGQTARELEQRDQWVRKNLAAVREVQAEVPAPQQKPQPGLFVLANHDPVQKNSRGGKAMKLGTTEYTRGLYCHATSRLLVRLPGPGRTFDAVIGVDHNENTQAGSGSVHFFVTVGGAEVFRSDLIRGGGAAGIPVRVELNGATEFLLCVDDAGDGIACDQADWADARVVLADGRTIWLADLPMVDGEVKPLRPREVSKPPFSFVYGGRGSDTLLGSWQFNETTEKLDANRSKRTQVYTDPKTSLVVRCEIVDYRDFPTVEWTLYFKNAGSTDTPILEDIQSLDTQFERRAASEFLLHHFVGSPCTAWDYRPLETSLKAQTTQRITGAGGRPTNSDLPYFNLETGDGGVIVAVGWPGQWAARFVRDAQTHLRIAAGQELTHLTLHPGEEIRTPLVVLQFYRGDWIDAQNTWRRWMWAHNVPRPGGKTLVPQIAACSSHQYGEMINADEASQKMFVERYLGEGLALDYWWMDAGWYWNKHGWPHVGTWEVDTNRFPNGLRTISDYAHARGVRTIVWFEPERVAADTWLSNTHPGWIHGGAAGGLLKLGEPEVLEWLTNHVDKLLVDQGVDLYRQDFNMDPLNFWRDADVPDRQGIAEIRHVTNYLAYWDELRRRHPNMLIDSCASGGRRNDLETLRRAVPLLRSDFLLEPVSQQNHTYGIAFWIPFYGTGINQFDAYSLRSCICPHVTACYDMRRQDQDYSTVRRLLRQWRQEIAPNYWGDFYPLTPYSMDDNVWVVWQFDRPECGQGMVQAFRRAKSEEKSTLVRLQGLDPQARYRLADIDTDRTWTQPGQELLERGLRIESDKQPEAVVVAYERMN
ncbi:MAG TPA: alpha-galactosidase [Sedimentisphaerales bacterium]|jgi:alpha-galactosidase|nr:alpha-galactosidase [Sedimentisphaerales bacterium]HNU28710.1 alpha-galactosidase [Sedimentisphaerales bacterium]